MSPFIDTKNNYYPHKTKTFLYFLVTTLATILIELVSSTVVLSGSTVDYSGEHAVLVPGKSMHLQCDMVKDADAIFKWYKIPLGQNQEVLMEPDAANRIDIYNERMYFWKPTADRAGDYICRATETEFASVKLRTQPYIEDFGYQTSHTGKSSTITEDDRLELLCTVRDKLTPVEITWLRSKTPDDDKNMVPLLEIPEPGSSSDDNEPTNNQFIKTFMAQEQSIIIETVDKHSKRLVIKSIKLEHRGYYGCIANNEITDKTSKVTFIRVRAKLAALWPLVGIVAQLFILFTIIHVWETRRAYKEMLFKQQLKNRLLQ